MSDLQPAVEKLSAICNQQQVSFQDALGATESFLRLRHTFIDHDRPGDAKDAFRHLRGFQTLLDFVRLLVNIYDVADLSQQDRRGLLMLLKDDLCVLGEALKDHPGNKRYFSKKIDGSGITSLEQILSSFTRKLALDFNNTNTSDSELFYGSLLAASLGQEMLCDCFSSLQKKITDVDSQNDSQDLELSTLRDKISDLIGTAETIENAEFIGPFLRLWLEQSVDSTKNSILRLAVPMSLMHLCSLSHQNLLAVHSTGVLTSLFPIVIHSERSKKEKEIYRGLATTLCCEGLNSMDDAAALYRAAHSSLEVSEFLLDATKASKNPPCIHFDLSRHGYCSIELPTLSRSFPPMVSAGYTFAAWVRVDQFDPNSHTTIFGAFDTSQACFVLAYLEKDTRNFILQTSIKGARPSVRFKSTLFTQSKWYHICVVHRRPRSTSSSRASLFVNGEHVEQVKAAYPAVPPSRPYQKPPRVQTFLGTPQDLASRLGKGVSMSKWSLASAVLFDEAMTDDIIYVFYHLGPRYHGNFQDSLGSFQTYKASAALNLRNESLHPGKEENSDIVSVIRDKGSILIPESSILLNFTPTAVLDDDDSNNVDESQLVKSLSKHAARNLQEYVKAGGNAIVINGGVPAINDALVQPHGVAILAGDPVVTVPQSLDDASWQVGGCTAVHLSMVEAANTPKLLLVAVELLFESVQGNWRNSDAMERENGYGILGMLLREKLGFPPLSQNTSSKTSPVCSSLEERNALSTELLPLILKFVGFDFDYPKRSVILNPLAYRLLLVDADIWRLGDIPLQGIYYSQFVTFSMESYYHRFNAKRLVRMRVAKKFLDALKEETFTSDSLKLFMPAFKSIVISCVSVEVLRSVALYITFSIHRQKTPPPKGDLQKKKSVRFEARPKWAPSSAYPGRDSEYLSKAQVGVEVMRAYVGILCSSDNTTNIKRFAKAVTNKWLIYLLVEDNAEVVVLTTTILARLLVLHGSGYTKKFADKTGGFVVMRHRLKRWWRIPALWPICFAILFGQDVAPLSLDRPFDRFSFLELFHSAGDLKVVIPEILPVITGMLQSALRSTVLNGDVADSQGSGTAQQRGQSVAGEFSDQATVHRDPSPDAALLNAVIGCLADIHCMSSDFRDFAGSSSYVKELLAVLFPVVVGSDSPSAYQELNSRGGRLTFGSQDLVIRPSSSGRPPLRTTTVEHSHPQNDGSTPRGSSFVLVSSDRSKYSPSSARLRPAVSYNIETPSGSLASHPIVQGILELVTGVFIDQILTRKDFSNLGLSQRIPPGFIEHQTFFESWLLRNILSQLESAIFLDQERLLDPRVLTNLSRLLAQVCEELYGGWYIHGATATLDFIGRILEYIQEPDVASLKSIRLCSQAISSLRSVASRIILLDLSQVEDSESLRFLEKLAYWQSVISSSQDAHSDNLSLLCYLLYIKLISEDDQIRFTSIKVLRTLLIQKPSETMAVLSHASSPVYKRLSSGFESLVNLDDVSVLRWIDDQRDDLDSLFFGVLSKCWDSFVRDENAKIEEASRARLSKRKEKLRQWDQADAFNENLIRNQDVSFDHWASNIFLTEQVKHQRALQDQQDNFAFLSLAFSHIYRDMRLENGILAEANDRKWRLDQTEGRNRMRLRIIPDDTVGAQDYRPKRKTSHEPPSTKIDNRARTTSESESGGVAITSTAFVAEPGEEGSQGNDSDDRSGLEESFEMIDDPNDDQTEYEDKNRKVIRSLHRGDQVQHVSNISRIVGLEACECLLILGKLNLYILDNFFQRSDGEIVNVWQAPREERDSYISMISGRESDTRRQNNGEHETRSWKWADVISVSKRRFLLRDVALEIFFADGRSYLLTLMSRAIRDELYQHLCTGSPHISGKINVSQPEDLWRFDALRSQEDQSQFFGSKLVNVFSQTPTHPATRKWMKGEISNFHYLMLVNTLAGRTFNDLTQYPVFPWVIADYTSDELDLTNPRTFRDFTKPMGAQHPEREAEFRSRYQSFAEMGDHNAPPFHYGTHYSSAMIVSSYLIRLQPFVKSYLLLQGGTFDHADRLFFSVARAWDSSSRVNMTDVRELIPEFFYLPEFLVNTNKYDFGLRQNKSQSIDSVELPPWAKGDPKIFIAKQREALESPYVSRNLHHWIDLVFGFKQRGEAALEATNVFHHLSYQGAKDLDNIEDPVERLATIGIIHNFGQTPHQVFQKSHPQREEVRHSLNRLDVAAESLTRLPFVLLDSEERVSSLIFSVKHDRLLCAAAFRLNIPPNYDKYMEWGFSDHSVRFYVAESRKLIGHSEHLHVGQLSCALFADSQTLITSGTDCAVSVWSFSSTSKSVDLNPKASLFGHRSPVTILTVSRSFSTILTASKDGKIMLWDLNRLEFVRSLPAIGAVDCARINDATGNIMICRNGRIDLYSLNGALILSHAVCESADEVILSCAFYEGYSNEWLERELLFTGHRKGLVNVWSKTIRNGLFELDLIKQLHHVDNSRGDGVNASAGISCILPLPQVVYTGDEAGRVYEWNCVQRR